MTNAMKTKERNKRINAAIQKAVQERKEKTWFDFYDVPFEEMEEYLSDDSITIPIQQYDYLCECRKFAESFRNLFLSWAGVSNEIGNTILQSFMTQPLNDIFQKVRQVSK